MKQGKTNVLISCVSKKQDLKPGEKIAAKDLYISTLFRYAWAYAEKNIEYDEIYILSAEHHLLKPNKQIQSYNKTLNSMATAEKKEWANIVLEEMKEANLDLENDKFYILAGKNYYKYLIGDGGIKNYEIVYQNCTGIGKILQYLKQHI